MRESRFLIKFKKETLTQVFSCEFCEISKNNFFTEHLRTTASNYFKVIISEQPREVEFILWNKFL